jgi:hypothetical protein
MKHLIRTMREYKGQVLNWIWFILYHNSKIKSEGIFGIDWDEYHKK